MPIPDPRDLHTAFAAAMNAGDAEAMLALYEPNAIFTTGPGVHVRGEAALLEAFRRFAGMRPRMQLTTRSVFIAGDIALMHAEYSLSGFSSDGTAARLRGVSAEVARRQADGGWLFVIGNAFAQVA